jgi:hypothetical protein
MRHILRKIPWLNNKLRGCCPFNSSYRKDEVEEEEKVLDTLHAGLHGGQFLAPPPVRTTNI